MKVAFLTLGCKVNFYETEKMTAEFRECGFEVVDFSSAADVYVINTCTVTNMADRKSRKMIHRARKKNPDSIVVAVGCYVESSVSEGKTDAAIDLAFSNKDKQGIARKILACLEKEELAGKYETAESNLHSAGGAGSERTRKYIKIQDGCNQFCSYCMIPYVRGGGILSSRDEKEVLEEIRQVADKGFKEVVLTGIHLSSYGVDKSAEKQFVSLKGAPLVGLLRQIDLIDGIERIRLGSLEPRIIGKEFLDGLLTVQKLCPHFHLSLQSGCDATLRRMNRHYTTEEYGEKCEQIRSCYSHPAITTDIITGFPGETDEEFEATRKFVEQVSLADIHVFPYSVRKGTKAARMENQVLPEIKRERSERLIADTVRLREKYEDWFVGKTERVLFEEIRELDGRKYLTGHNERYVLLGVPLQEAERKGYAENEIHSVQVGENACLMMRLMS